MIEVMTATGAINRLQSNRYHQQTNTLQCSDTVGSTWLGGRKGIRPVESWVLVSSQYTNESQRREMNKDGTVTNIEQRIDGCKMTGKYCTIGSRRRTFSR